MCIRDRSLYDKKFLKQFLQIGSSEIYGATNQPAKETDQPKPTSPYSISKLATDLHLLSCYSHNGFPSNIIRPSNCYGRYQLMYRLIPKAIIMAMNGQKFPLEGGGVAEKSFMHAYDLADAIIKILNSKKHGQIYNAGSTKPIKMREIVEVISELMKVKFEDFVENVPGRSTEDARYWIDSSKIKSEMGWEPKISLKDGIKDVINWISSQIPNYQNQGLKSYKPDLNKIKSCIKLTGYVNSTDKFIDQPKVINGASDIIASIFGSAGMHTRAAVSTNSLPLGVSVEVDAIFLSLIHI